MLSITEQFDFFSSALDSLLGIGCDVNDSADPGSLIPSISLDGNKSASVTDDNFAVFVCAGSTAVCEDYTDKVGTQAPKSITAPPLPPDFGSFCAAP
jgi:hypothetical protein